jgi:hypothetical protein
LASEEKGKGYWRTKICQVEEEVDGGGNEAAPGEPCVC